MIFSGFKEKLIANFKGLSKKKYLIYCILMVISSALFGILKRDVSSVIFLIALFLFIIIVDLFFDLLGYFKDTEETKKTPIGKRILGYIIGTIIFIMVGIILLRIVESIF